MDVPKSWFIQLGLMVSELEGADRMQLRQVLEVISAKILAADGEENGKVLVMRVTA